MFWLNTWLSNNLNDTPPPRTACYVVGELLYVYIYGGNHIIYNSNTNVISPQIKKPLHSFDLSKEEIKQVDKSLCRRIYEKKTGAVKKTLDDEIKEKYNISKKNKLTEKQLAEIAKYEARKKGNWQDLDRK